MLSKASETADVGTATAPGMWWASTDTAADYRTVHFPSPLVPVGPQVVAVGGASANKRTRGEGLIIAASDQPG